MDIERERALVLAHDAEPKDGSASTDSVIERARRYLDFLRGTHDAKIIQCARDLAEKIRA